jgi:four helix bundle protein
LRSFQVATLIYDATVSFCERFLNPRSRMVDQMVQAARSGRQNIAEGSRASAASSQTEIRLVNVARASLDELLLDYEDFQRQRGTRPRERLQRPKRSGESDRTDRSGPTDQSDRFFPYAQWLTHADPALVANTLICLIHQANYLLAARLRVLSIASLRTAATPNVLPPRESLTGAKAQEKDGAPRVHSAARPWPYEPHAKAPAPVPGSGDALATRNAEARAALRNSANWLDAQLRSP